MRLRLREWTVRRRWRLRRISSRIALAAVFFVGADDALHQRMPDATAPGELDDGDAVDGFQGVVGLKQAGMFVRRQVDLRLVAGDDRLGTVPEPGEEHEHLFGGG